LVLKKGTLNYLFESERKNLEKKYSMHIPKSKFTKVHILPIIKKGMYIKDVTKKR
jgi:NADH:ubiquinone oxidoreductase subunit D